SPRSLSPPPPPPPSPRFPYTTLFRSPDEPAVDIPPQGRAGELLAAVPQERAERPPDVGRLQPVELAVKGREHVHALRGGGEKLRSEEHTSELQSRVDLVCRLLLEKKK